MIAAIISSSIIIALAIAGYIVRNEHRLTGLETKIDLLLNHNGIKGGKDDRKSSQPG